jgi:hypothetical protein
MPNIAFWLDIVWRSGPQKPWSRQFCCDWGLSSLAPRTTPLYISSISSLSLYLSSSMNFSSFLSFCNPKKYSEALPPISIYPAHSFFGSFPWKSKWNKGLTWSLSSVTTRSTRAGSLAFLSSYGSAKFSTNSFWGGWTTFSINSFWNPLSLWILLFYINLCIP